MRRQPVAVRTPVAIFGIKIEETVANTASRVLRNAAFKRMAVRRFGDAVFI